MSARRTARKLAITIIPLISREKELVSESDIEHLVARAVHMLVDHARQLLDSATAELRTCFLELGQIEENHPDNKLRVEVLNPVKVTTDQLREQYEKVEQAVNLVNEALSIPDLALHAGKTRISVPCSKCKSVSSVTLERDDRSEIRQFVTILLASYLKNKERIDEILKRASANWKVDRMVSTDRDILRLACCEMFYMPDIPIKVAINEAVELCHQFADARAAKFINGVLGDLVGDAEYFRETGDLSPDPIVLNGGD